MPGRAGAQSSALKYSALSGQASEGTSIVVTNIGAGPNARVYAPGAPRTTIIPVGASCDQDLGAAIHCVSTVVPSLASLSAENRTGTRSGPAENGRLIPSER